MNFKERITYSKDEMLSSLNIALENMSVFRFDSRYRQYLGEAFVDKFVAREADIKRRKDDPFTVVVVGNFKRGKSTLINALLQEEVVTTDVTPETMTLNRIFYGLQDNKLILSGNRKISLANEELYRDKLEGIINELGEPVNQLNISRPNEFLKRVTLIDTPGIDDATKDYSEMVKLSLLQADAIIYVFNILYPLSQTEQFFMRSAILPQKFTKLFIVGNYTDNAETKESVNRIKSVIRSRLKGLLPDAKFYMVSALDELCRVSQKKRPNEDLADTLEGEFNFLRQDLNYLVNEKAESVVTDRMQRLITAMLSELNTELESIERGISMSKEEAQAQLNQMQAEHKRSIRSQKELLENMTAQIGSMRDEAKLWMREFLQRIIDETKNLSAESNENLRKYYEYYCIDLLQTAMKTCLEFHQEQLYDILESVASSITEKFVWKTIHENYQFRFKLDNRIWTKGDSAGLAVSFLNGVSFLSTIGSLAIDGITGYLREREIHNRTPEIISQINLKLAELSFSINKTINKVYIDLGNNVEKLIVEYFQSELDNNEHLVKQAISISEKEEESKKQIAEVLQMAKKILESVRSQTFTTDISDVDTI